MEIKVWTLDKQGKFPDAGNTITAETVVSTLHAEKLNLQYLSDTKPTGRPEQIIYEFKDDGGKSTFYETIGT